MSEEDLLLKAICDAPDEDTPRLVFADWLQERGNPFDTAWASVIRAQVRLARLETGEERGELEKKVKALDTPFFHNRWHRRLTLPEGHSLWCSGEWDRGFLCELVGSFSAIESARSLLAYRIPYQSLNIGILDLAQFRLFLSWHELRRLTSLSVHGVNWDLDFNDEYAAALASCAALAGLTALHLRFMSITDRGAADLLDSIHLRGVRELSLTWTDQPGGTLSRGVRKRLRDRFGPHCLR